MSQTINTNYLTLSGREEAWRFTPIKKLADFLSADTKLETSKSFTLEDGAVTLNLEENAINPVSNTDEDRKSTRLNSSH